MQTKKTNEIINAFLNKKETLRSSYHQCNKNFNIVKLNYI